MRGALRGPLVRNTGWLTASQGARIAAQAATFVLLARALGPHGLGAVSAALALVFMFVPFAGLGQGNLLVLRVARDRAVFPRAFGRALIVTTASGAVLAPLAAALGVWLVRLDARVVVPIACAELLLGRLCEVSGQAFQSLERLLATALLGLVTPLLRLGAVAAFAVSSAPRPEGWAIWYLLASGGATVVCLVSVLALVGRPRFGGDGWALGRGVLFSVTQFASLLTADADKVLLARLDSLGVVGVYTAAYRMTSFAMVPVVALTAATYARFFSVGTAGLTATRAFASRLLRPSMLYAATASAALFLVAPLGPTVLGTGFSEASEALRWLAPIPVLQTLAVLAGDALTGADHQGVRTGVQVGVASLNVGLNLLLIPASSWRGAAWATLASLVVLAASLWLAVAVLSRERRQRIPLPIPPAS